MKYNAWPIMRYLTEVYVPYRIKKSGAFKSAEKYREIVWEFDRRFGRIIKHNRSVVMRKATVQLVDEFEQALVADGRGPACAADFADVIRAIIRHWRPDRMPARVTKPALPVEPKPNAKPKAKIPQYRRIVARGREYAAVLFNGRSFQLGRYDSEESHAKYHRMIAEYLASGCSPTYGLPVELLSVGQMVESYLEHAEKFYGKGTRGEYANLKYATRPLVKLYADWPAEKFGPRQFKAVRQEFIKDSTTGKVRSRRYVNDSMQRMTRAFRWAAEEELISSDVPQALSMVAGLRRGRSEAVESGSIKPVSMETVEATLPHLPPVLRAMIGFQLATGCRPGEVVILRPIDIDRSEDVWKYRPYAHKTMLRGKDRTIYIGPLGQEILRPYLLRPDKVYCFSPDDGQAQSKAKHNAETPRKTKKFPAEAYRVECQRTIRKNRRLRSRVPRRYKTGSYYRAIRYGCEKAFGENGTRWHPNQLRHTAGTAFRKKYGLEAAQVLLGHSEVAVTQIYAERNEELAIRVAREAG